MTYAKLKSFEIKLLDNFWLILNRFLSVRNNWNYLTVETIAIQVCKQISWTSFKNKITD